MITIANAKIEAVEFWRRRATIGVLCYGKTSKGLLSSKIVIMTDKDHENKREVLESLMLENATMITSPCFGDAYIEARKALMLDRVDIAASILACQAERRILSYDILTWRGRTCLFCDRPSPTRCPSCGTNVCIDCYITTGGFDHGCDRCIKYLVEAEKEETKGTSGVPISVRFGADGGASVSVMSVMYGVANDVVRCQRLSFDRNGKLSGGLWSASASAHKKMSQEESAMFGITPLDVTQNLTWIEKAFCASGLTNPMFVMREPLAWFAMGMMQRSIISASGWSVASERAHAEDNDDD